MQSTYLLKLLLQLGKLVVIDQTCLAVQVLKDDLVVGLIVNVLDDCHNGLIDLDKRACAKIKSIKAIEVRCKTTRRDLRHVSAVIRGVNGLEIAHYSELYCGFDEQRLHISVESAILLQRARQMKLTTGDRDSGPQTRRKAEDETLMQVKTSQTLCSPPLSTCG